MAIPSELLAVLWAASACWLVLAWTIHLRHLPATSPQRRSDLAIRWFVVVALVAFGVGGLTGGIAAVPLFIAVKCLLLATAMLAGLVVRRALGPLFVAVRAMAANGPTPEGDAIMRHIILHRSKPTVMGIWIIITAAALCGIATPV